MLQHPVAANGELLSSAALMVTAELQSVRRGLNQSKSQEWEAGELLKRATGACRRGKQLNTVPIGRCAGVDAAPSLAFDRGGIGI